MTEFATTFVPTRPKTNRMMISDSVSAQLAPWRKKRALVVGFTERTGYSASSLFLKLGIPHAISDARSEEELRPIWEKLPEPRPQLFSGPQNTELLKDFDWVLLSPGVPRSAPWLKEAAARHIPLWNDVDWLSQFFETAGVEPVVVTGTDGKSTVTHLLAHVLQTEFKAPAVGNNGVPVLAHFEEILSSRHPVIEASSYMLEDLKALRPRVGMITNLASDHLDRYPSLTAYHDAKKNLVRHMKSDDTWIVNLDNPGTAAFRPQGPRILTVSRKLQADVMVDEERIILGETITLPLSTCRLQGAHHVENMLMAAAAALDLGMAPARVAEKLANFSGLPHRCQRVDVRRPIQVFDDSKATTVQSVQKAVEGLPAPIVLILGGRSKGLDFTSLRAFASRLRHVIFYGEAAAELRRSLPELPGTERGSFAEAVESAWQLCQTGDTLLLSPGCTSWDQHRDYAERGQQFQAIVKKLDEKYS